MSKPIELEKGECGYMVYSEKKDTGKREIAGIYKSIEEARNCADHMNEKEYIASKQYLCDLLLPALQKTRNLFDLIALEYDPVTQYVIATFENGAKKRANVAHDSGTTMILDIINRIM